MSPMCLSRCVAAVCSVIKNTYIANKLKAVLERCITHVHWYSVSLAAVITPAVGVSCVLRVYVDVYVHKLDDTHITQCYLCPHAAYSALPGM
jgi:hypothetical protein